ncbi:GMC family oxidoreductase [Caballeronia sp. 15711]|uniref:GMC family oxidoreductase n=1 Tax=Caballeronia sp. 15711 TaxID=3391029 RepID=UPI0039E58908
MTKFDYNDESVVVIVGSGPGGATLAKQLCAKGVKVVMLEAGSRLTPNDFIQDETRMSEKWFWPDKRVLSGVPGLPLMLKTVGGTANHFSGCAIRFQSHEFKALSTYGGIAGANLLDWPLTFDEMLPYYEQAELNMGVTQRHDMPPLPGSNNFKVFYAGAKKLGFSKVHTGYMAINSVARDGRPPCQQMGFCLQGCKLTAKWSPLYVEIPKAESTGNLDLRVGCTALQVHHDAQGKATGVLYADRDGKQQFQKARIVSIAANSVETPRLFLNSATSKFSDGLANGSGQVGKNYMSHCYSTVYGIFDKPVHMHRGTVQAGLVEDMAGYDPKRGFPGGYYLQLVHFGPNTHATVDLDGSLGANAWGKDASSIVDTYDYQAGLWVLGEDMPMETSRVTLNEEKDKFGLSIPNVHFDSHPMDQVKLDHGIKVGSELYKSVGARRTYKVDLGPGGHNMGTMRMSANARDGVVNKFGQTHEISNLFVSDGSQFTTSGSPNPTLTIVALSLRQADYIIEQMKKNQI